MGHLTSSLCSITKQFNGEVDDEWRRKGQYRMNGEKNMRLVHEDFIRNTVAVTTEMQRKKIPRYISKVDWEKSISGCELKKKCYNWKKKKQQECIATTW